jgi:uncharacterized protein (TIGR03435 family)
MDWRASGVEHIWYDVDATWEDPALKDKWPEMLQPLLVERFSVKSHLEYRPTKLYTLSVAKPSALEKCKATDDDIVHQDIDRGNPEAITFKGMRFNEVIW